MKRIKQTLTEYGKSEIRRLPPEIKRQMAVVLFLEAISFFLKIPWTLWKWS